MGLTAFPAQADVLQGFEGSGVPTGDPATAGTYPLNFEVASVMDKGVPSGLGIDNIQETSPGLKANLAAVSEPSQFSSMGLGLFGLAGLMLRARRRRPATV